MFDKITSRISNLSDDLDLDYIDPVCQIIYFLFIFIFFCLII